MIALVAALRNLEHDKARELFAPLVDEAIAANDEQALREHLAECPDCRLGLEQYQRAVGLARSAERVAVPADFSSKVLQRVRNRRRRGLFGFQGGRLVEQIGIPASGALPVILVAALAALAVLFLLSQN